MQIEVKARTFFEVLKGGKREKELMRTYRGISINNVNFPAEPPPFSEEFLHAENLLVLYFDDVDEGPNAMTEEQAKQIVDFVCIDDPRPIIVHCTAGISRSGAVGEVLNWYFNRYLEDNQYAYRMFEVSHSDIIPNAHVRKLLLNALQKRHENLNSMLRKIRLRENRQRLIYTISGKLANKIYDILNPYFDDYDCLCFSEIISCDNPKMLEYAVRKFRHSDCGITRCNGMILVIDAAGRGEMREIFSQFLKMAMPKDYMFKGNDAEKFFQSFEKAIKSNIMHNCIKYDDVLRLIMADPHTATRYALADQMGRGGNMWMRHLIYEHAKRFDECYAEYERMKKNAE